MNGRLGCSVDSAELKQPEERQPSVVDTYVTTHCIRILRYFLLSINDKGFLYLSTSHHGIALLQSGNQDCIFWVGYIVIIQAVMGLKSFKVPILSSLAFKRGLERWLRLWCETGDVTSLTILPIEDGRVAGHAVLDKSAISIFNLKERANSLTSQTTTVPAFQRIRA
jgi:hypothetical protein